MQLLRYTPSTATPELFPVVPLFLLLSSDSNSQLGGWGAKPTSHTCLSIARSWGRRRKIPTPSFGFYSSMLGQLIPYLMGIALEEESQVLDSPERGKPTILLISITCFPTFIWVPHIAHFFPMDSPCLLARILCLVSRDP